MSFFFDSSDQLDVESPVAPYAFPILETSSWIPINEFSRDPMQEMLAEEGFALGEWRRQNAARLEEKEKTEKELLSQTIDEAEEYKSAFYILRKVTCETKKARNQEKEKLFVASQEKFYVESDKNYWKTIADLIPNEASAIDKKGGKKNQEKEQPSVVEIQGPKPGKPTELSRMRHILLKLKNNTPAHLKPSAATEDTKMDPPAGAATPPRAVAVA